MFSVSELCNRSMLNEW